MDNRKTIFNLINTKDFPKEMYWMYTKEFGSVIGINKSHWHTESNSSYNSVENSETEISQCDENETNQNRLQELHKKVTPQFLSLLEYEDFQFGITSKAEELLKSQLEVNYLAALNWINSLYIKNFKNEKILRGLVYIIGNIPENKIGATGKTIALASLSHKSDEIKEFGIRAFENWASYESFETLSNLKIDTPWLQDYINQIVEDLKIELCLS